MLGAYSNLPLIEIWVSWRGLQFNNNKDRTQMRDHECHSVSARILHTRTDNLFCFDISMRKNIYLWVIPVACVATRESGSHH